MSAASPRAPTAGAGSSDAGRTVVAPSSRNELMLIDAELREAYTAATLMPDGRSRRGRKTKHDTATRRWIDTVGFPCVELGKRPPEADMAMLKLTPRSSLSGANLIARDAWSQLHGRDPRSKQQTAAEQAVMAHVDAAVGSDGAIAGSDDEGDGEEGEDDGGGDGGADARSTAASVLQTSRQQIEAYAASQRTSDLALPTSLSDNDRKELHALAHTLKLEATSVGVGGDRQLIVRRWKPLVAFTAAIGTSALRGGEAMAARGPAACRKP